MKKINEETLKLIKHELANIPAKYAETNFNSAHEGYAVLLEEVEELKGEIFWGEKKAKKEYDIYDMSSEFADELWKGRMKSEAIQVAAMAIRFIQECT